MIFWKTRVYDSVNHNRKGAEDWMRDRSFGKLSSVVL